MEEEKTVLPEEPAETTETESPATTESEATETETPASESPEEGKPAKKGFRAWWQAHKPTKRRLIQVYVALLTNANIKGFATGRIYAGATKNFCVPGLNCYSCPGAVGACPLGSLQNAFAQSGTRAPVYVIGILLLLGVIFARTICGFLCPFGLYQDLLYKIRTPKLKKSRFTRVLSYFKYVLLAVLVIAVPLIYGIVGQVAIPAFCKYVCPAGTLGGAIGLLVNPANADLYAMLGGLFTWKFAVLAAVSAACVFVYRAFCRFLCPLGAIYGFFNKIALLGVKIDENKCTDCGLCISHCKMDVKKVGDHECINCGECIPVCPAKAIRWKGSKLFVHENAVEAAAEAPADARPLDGLLKGNVSEASAAEISDTPAPVSMPSESGIPAESGAAPVENAAAKAAVAESAAAPAAPRKRRGKAFWLTLTAWIAALALLVGALVYYNFLAPTPRENGHEVGDVCYDFTLASYGGDDYTLSSSRGKIVVINFWATWCGPCVEELPEFAQVAEKYSGDVEVLAIHSSNVTEDVENFLATKTDALDESDSPRVWKDFSVKFLQDTGDLIHSDVFEMLGGKDSYPVTLILDREGVIVFLRQGSVTRRQLENQVNILLNNEE